MKNGANDILKVQGLGISFGSNQVLKNVNFELHENEVLGVMGPNGSGKTVMLDILTGILKPASGSIIFNGRNINRESITKRVRSGIGRTFQIPKPFEKMTVFENLMVGACFGADMSQKEAGEKVKEIARLIGFSDEKLKIAAGKLGLLDRKCLEIGRGLATQPKVLLLDEAGGGLTEPEVKYIIRLVKDIKSHGISVIWIEHIVRTMIEGTDRLLLLADGRDIICGNPVDVINSKEAVRVYMGEEE